MEFFPHNPVFFVSLRFPGAGNWYLLLNATQKYHIHPIPFIHQCFVSETFCLIKVIDMILMWSWCNIYMVLIKYWYEMMWYDMIWHDIDIMWYDMILMMSYGMMLMKMFRNLSKNSLQIPNFGDFLILAIPAIDWFIHWQIFIMIDFLNIFPYNFATLAKSLVFVSGSRVFH